MQASLESAEQELMKAAPQDDPFGTRVAAPTVDAAEDRRQEYSVLQRLHGHLAQAAPESGSAEPARRPVEAEPVEADPVDAERAGEQPTLAAVEAEPVALEPVAVETVAVETDEAADEPDAAREEPADLVRGWSAPVPVSRWTQDEAAESAEVKSQPEPAEWLSPVRLVSELRSRAAAGSPRLYTTPPKQWNQRNAGAPVEERLEPRGASLTRRWHMLSRFHGGEDPEPTSTEAESTGASKPQGDDAVKAAAETTAGL